MKKRLISLILLACILATAFSSCQGKDENVASSDDTTAAETGPVEIPSEPQHIDSLTISGTTLSAFCVQTDDSTLSSSGLALINHLKTYSDLTSGGDVLHPNFLIAYKLDGYAPAYDDWKITFKDQTICFVAGSRYSAEVAVRYFIENYLKVGGNISVAVPEGNVLKTFTAPSREEYLADPTLMPLHWQYRWEPRETMVDYNTKKQILTQENKTNVLTVSHRGDFLFYPENSIESMISVWAMGGDVLEIDIHFTKDGVPVVMHDANLKRMTNYSACAGKNGLPTSANISDWTLEQIKTLYLKEGQGGSNSSLTPYRIPTLEECLEFAKGRIFFILDKPSEWRYVDLDGLQPNSAAKFIYPYMKSTGNFESVLISYGTLDSTAEGTLDATEALRIQKFVKSQDGADMYFFLRGWTTRSTAAPYASLLTKYSETNSGVLVNGAFNPTNSSVISAVKQIHKAYPDTLLGGWTIDDNGYDCPATWELMYETGYRSIMTNNMFALVQWAATKVEK